MARRYNPEYIRTIMQKPFLAAIEVCIIATEGRFGVSSDNHGQFKVEDFVDAEVEAVRSLRDAALQAANLGHIRYK